jgi:nucleoside-diphosphate-sugar epimerase
MSRTVTLLGAQLPFGPALTRALSNSGWNVHLVLGPGEQPPAALASALHHSTQVEPGSVQALSRALESSEAVVVSTDVGATGLLRHGGALQTCLAAAENTKTRILAAASIWGLGQGHNKPVPPGRRNTARTRAGAICARAEDMLRDTCRQRRIHATQVRLPRLLGAGALDPLLATFARPALQGRQAVWPGPLGLRHELLHVDDAARALAAALERRGVWEEFHVAGFAQVEARAFEHLVRELTGGQATRGKLSLWLDRLRWRGPAEWAELTYVFREELLLDGSAFAKWCAFVPKVDYHTAWADSLKHSQ